MALNEVLGADTVEEIKVMLVVGTEKDVMATRGDNTRVVDREHAWLNWQRGLHRRR